MSSQTVPVNQKRGSRLGGLGDDIPASMSSCERKKWLRDLDGLWIHEIRVCLARTVVDLDTPRERILSATGFVSMQFEKKNT